MLKESLDRLCNIAGGFAVVATAGAATGGVVLGVAGAMAAGGSLLACIQQHRRADFSKVLKKPRFWISAGASVRGGVRLLWAFWRGVEGEGIPKSLRM